MKNKHTNPKLRMSVNHAISHAVSHAVEMEK